jgi:FkbM family methyltransferase
MSIKDTIKKIIKKIPIDFTQNQRYDTQTRQVIARVCRPDSNCVDVGCHKGEMLDTMLRYAPKGTHYGFEPIPTLYNDLCTKYPHCHILPFGLSRERGTSTFNYVVSNPAYSGLQQRKYVKEEKIELITIQIERLDDVLPLDYKADLIKIDVEGGELLVLEGAKAVIKRAQSVVIFEHGLGGSDFYGGSPEKLYDLLVNDLGMKISLMKYWLNGKPPLTLTQLKKHFYNSLDYYYIAYFD